MDSPKLALPTRLLVSDTNEPAPGRDDLSSPTVRFNSISLQYVIDFWAEVLDNKRGIDVKLFVLSETVGDVAKYRTGRLEREEGDMLYLFIPFRESGLLEVRRSQVRAIERGEWSTEDVVQFVVLPEQMASETSVVDNIDSKHVGKPFQGFFVSQARACKFSELLSSLRFHFTNNPPAEAISFVVPQEGDTVKAGDENSDPNKKGDKKAKGPFAGLAKLKVKIAKKMSTPDKPASDTEAAKVLKKDIKKGQMKRFSGMHVDFSKIFIWLDVFAANQPQLCAQHPDPEVQSQRYGILQTGLHSALAHFEDRVIFFDDFDHPKPISRAWCVWELYGVALKSLSLSIVCPPKVAAELEGKYLNGTLNVLTMISNLEPRDMQCFNVDDLNMIKSHVEQMDGGWVKLKQTISDTLRRWMLNFANNLREKRMKEIKKKSRAVETADGDCLYRTAILLNEFGENNLSIEYSNAAVAIYETLSDKVRVAYCWRELGKVYLNLKKPEEALKLHKQELDYYLKYKAETGRDVSVNDNALLGGCYMGIGNDLDGMGKFTEAMDNYNKAYDYYVLGYTAKSLDAANVCICKGRTLQSLKKYDESLAMFNSALATKLSLFGPRNVTLGYDYSNRAWLYQEMQQYDLALKDMFMAWELRKEVLGEMHDMTALAYNHIAYCYRLQEKWDQSTEFYLKAINIYEVIHPNQKETADLYNNLGYINSRIPRYEKCVEFYTRAQEVYTAANETVMANQMAGYIQWAKNNIKN